MGTIYAIWQARDKARSVMLLRLEARKSLRIRQCFVCEASIPSGEGCFHAALKILTCEGICVDVVEREARCFDRSLQGRWRRPADVLRRIYTLRTSTKEGTV